MFRFPSRLPNLETILWILASIVAFLALLVFIPSFFSNSPGTNTAGVERQPTVRPSLTPLKTPTATNTLQSVLATAQPQRLTPFPTPLPNTQAFEFASSLGQSGWFATGETDLHVGDRNLHAGAFKGQIFQSLIVFDMASLAPSSKVRYAQVELTGLNRGNIGPGGKWTLQLLMGPAANPGADLRTLAVQADIGAALVSDQLAEGQLNQFIFSADQLSLLDAALNGTGRVYFRLSGPTSSDNLFTWDGGDRDPTIGPHPTLRLIATPAQYTVITTTPTPQNVLTAAAVLLRGTDIARRGTPTALPRVFATATPQIIVTGVPTPANSETATAVAAYATAVALTTGTFTPTPLNWITATPVPLLIAVAPTVTPSPTATPTIAKQLFSRKPIPSGFYNKILFLGGSRTQPSVFVMDPDGKKVLELTNHEIYDIVAARDNFSPDGNIEAFNAPDLGNPDGLQIWIWDHTQPLTPSGPVVQMTFHQKGISFAPTWSPDQKKIAYTSTEARYQEIYILDFETKKSLRITNTQGEYSWNQFPSWSPDGTQIVYSSDRGHIEAFTEIWVMNANGTGQHKLLDWGRDAWAPVWVKWNK